MPKNTLSKFALVLAALAMLASVGRAALAEHITGYAPVDLSKWQPREAASAMALLEPIYRNHPESLEGDPELDIEFEEVDGVLVAEIEMSGMLDDAVKGAEYRAIIKRVGNVWRLDQLGVRWECYRGGGGLKPCS